MQRFHFRKAPISHVCRMGRFLCSYTFLWHFLCCDILGVGCFFSFFFLFHASFQTFHSFCLITVVGMGLTSWLLGAFFLFFFFPPLIFIYLFIFIFGCVVSSLLCAGFL